MQTLPKLAILRGEAGLTQEELAEKAGVAASTIVDIERGHVRRPHFTTLRRLAEALGVEFRDLLDEAS